MNHKHCNLIKLWADGVEIEYRYTENGKDWSEWFVADSNDLHWTDLQNYEYRLKNNPVAWMQTWQNKNGEIKQTVNIERIGINDIPLYTTPQIKPLSDSEIQTISHRYHYTYNPDYIGFARAIEERILGNVKRN